MNILQKILVPVSISFTVTLIVMIFQNIPLWIGFFLVGIAVGVLLYEVIRHHIPFGKTGKVTYFTFGFIIYSILIIISWYL